MVYRIFTEKKKELAAEARALLSDINSLLQIKSVTDVRVINRYDAQNITEELFDYSVGTVFSEPQLDITYSELEDDSAACFAVEYLPGQFDQRADSAAQCIQLISQGDRPLIRTAKVYMLYGSVAPAELEAIKKYVINPVEAREASLEKPDTLEIKYDIPSGVATLDGFTALDSDGLADFVSRYGLAMDTDDIKFCQDYFKSERRDPTMTEIRMIDTYWSDHCRHTTFLTHIDSAVFEDELLQSAYDEYMAVRRELGRTKPVCLMDIATVAVKYLKAHGKLDKLDESEEINACTVKIKVNVDGSDEDWLLLFKNETHNHPTEIEPFGGAATCIGGAIRDPLSGRSYVYGAMRITGAANPLKKVSETLPGKLPQRKIVTTAADGYSSYGNQIGLATGIVDEIYHDGYAAKRMEIGAVIAAAPEKPQPYGRQISGGFAENFAALADDLNICSKRGLAEQFDSTIGAGTVLMPFGGRNQLTPIQAMVQKISVEKRHTDDCSLMAWGYNPFISEKSPYHGAYLAVIESVSKLIATGAEFSDVYLTFQEYFERLGKDERRWGKPLAALLGAFKAQTDLGIAAIGGKDSMSGTFEKLDVPPTLVSFAVTTDKVKNVTANEFKKAGDKVVLIAPEYNKNDLPDTASLLAVYGKVTSLLRSGKALACYTPTCGGIAEAVMKMCFGNSLGFKFSDGISLDTIFGYCYGGFLLEVTEDIEGAVKIGEITSDGKISYRGEEISLGKLLGAYEDKLESVFRCNISSTQPDPENFSYIAQDRAAPAVRSAKPRVLIPVFPGTNCEYDSAKAMRDAGAEPEIFVINNRSADKVAESVERFAESMKKAQIVFIPGGFSGGDEPDGSGKFITAFFRNAAVKAEVADLLDNRGGLMCGICNGFQALIKLGLVPYGRIIDTDESCPTLTYNTIARHQSKIVRTRIASNKSPWLAETEVGDIYSVPISHGEGRFIASDELIRQLAANGQIATQYVDLDGNASSDIRFNPNGSFCAIEGITSPDGRVFGKMGHSERYSCGLYKNVPGDYNIKMFESAVKYFK